MEDIVYKEERLSVGDEKILKRFQDEMSAMQNLRNSKESEWKRLERQFDAKLDSQKGEIKNRIAEEAMRNQNGATVKIQIDRNTLEQQLGEEGFNIPYRVVPVGKNADSHALELGKYTLDFFIRKEDVISEIIDFRWDRGKYGT